MRHLILLLLLRGATLAAQGTPCCTITAIDRSTGVVSGEVAANRNTFQFKTDNSRTLATLKVGQGVYVNFTAHRVSLDGRSACCVVSSGPTPPARTVQQAVVAKVPPIALAMPSISYGAPQPVSRLAPAAAAGPLPRFGARTITASIAGRTATAHIIHLRGLDGIEQAPGLPDGARRLLEMHVRKLQPGEPDHYIVNLDLANQWLATHPVPADIRPADEDKNTHSGCNTWSMHCAGEAAAHAADQVQQLVDQASDAWNHASDELSKDWNTVAGCFADATLSLPDVPVKFDASPGMSVDLSTTTSSKLSSGGSTSAKVDGTLGLSFPMQSDFSARLDLFYIPCLPFVVRPKQIGADGTITVGEDLKASASASGSFDKTFAIPPTGGPRIPIEVIPIVIAGVPVAEMDVSAYVEGDVAVSGKGTVGGQFEVKNPHKASFDFSCGGSGCSGGSHGMPDPTTATESASIRGTLAVRPDIFTALQLDFDVDALSARAGPQPYLLGEAAGCAAVAGSQSTSGASTGSENHLLAADLDWGVDLRAEALIGGKAVGGKYQHSVTANKHLWFRDLAPGGSTSLDVLVTPVGAAAVNQPASYKVKMPSCYPYTGAVEYRVTWTGGGAPAANPACKWQASTGTCNFDPSKDLLLSFVWSGTGSHRLSIMAVGDQHDGKTRTFEPAPKPTDVDVTPAPSG